MKRLPAYIILALAAFVASAYVAAIAGAILNRSGL